MNKKNNRKGFTIVELVIVIAVIAILATVLVPTFGNVIDKANDSKAVQAAKNAYTLYAANINYATGEKAEEVVYYVDGDIVVKVEKGEATIAELPASGTCYTKIDKDGADTVVVNGCTTAAHAH